MEDVEFDNVDIDDESSAPLDAAFPTRKHSLDISCEEDTDDDVVGAHSAAVGSNHCRYYGCMVFLGLFLVAATTEWGGLLTVSRSLDQSPRLPFDVDGPPGRQQQLPFGKRAASTLQKTKRVVAIKGNSNGQRKLPFPVIDDDDTIPGQSDVAMTAADKLECRESVIDYVVNATDAKDECDGLKKAFDKTCNSDSTQEILDSGSSEGGRKKRRLFESTHNLSWKRQTLELSVTINRFLRRCIFFRRRPDLFFPEEEILGDSWDRAKFLVQNTIDEEETNDSGHTYQKTGEFSSRTRALVETESNETVVKKVDPHVDKPLQSLSLPTSSQHVSNQMLSETLMLRDEGGVIKSAMATAANNTNTTNLKHAAADAVMSSNAVAEASAAVSAVLNDPTSIEARTCCASILNVFHENCNFPEGEEVSDKRLIIIFFVIACCGVVKSLIRHFEIRWLPEAGGCILVGVVGGAILAAVPHYDLSFDGNWFLRIMVPPIVFEAAVSIDKKSFNRHLVPIVIYAVAGTLLATALTAFVVHRGSLMLNALGLCGTIPFVESLTFGALISSIDPIAVLSVLSNMGMTDTDTIYVVIFGESLLNDGVSIVLFQTLTHFLDESLIIDGEAVMAAAVHFLVVALGSLFVGIASGMLCTVYYWLMHGCHQPLVEVLTFFCWAFMPYYLCDGIEWSGIVAVVATGFVMDLFVVGGNEHHGEAGFEDSDKQSTPVKQSDAPKRQGRRGRPVFSREGHLSSLAKTHVGFVTEILSTMMETAIFAYLGLFLFSYRYHWNAFHTMIAILGCCLSRGVMIPSMSLLANWITAVQQFRGNCRPQRICDIRRGNVKNPAGVIIDGRMQLVLWFAGLRGAMSFALVEHIPLYDPVTGLGSRLKPELKAMTSACIIFTVFVLGGYTFFMMERMGLAPTKESKNVEMTSLLHVGSEDKNSFDMDDAQMSLDPKFRQRHSPSLSRVVNTTIPLA